MTMNRVIGVAAATGCAALAIGGCGTAHAPSRALSSPAPSASASPQQRASADAASILASFVPPPGAVRLTTAPGALRSQAGAIRGASDIVRDTSYWRVNGSPQAVLTWVKNHLPGRFTATGGGTVGGPAMLWNQTFALQPVAGVLPARGLEVGAVKAGGGQSALRVDAQVTWEPAKPSSERIPAAANVVTVSPASMLVAGAKAPSPVTITNAATVRRIAALVDGLPLLPPGTVNCPADYGRSVQMTFSAGRGGPPLAVVTAAISGCQGVRVMVGGKAQPTLSGTGAARQVLSIAGLRWSGYAGGGRTMPGGGMPGGGRTMPGGGMANPGGGSVNPGGPMRGASR